MAAKKKQQLTIEEKMQQALVPREEQPYKIPANWCWAKMGNIANWGSGGTPSRKIKEYYNGNIPWVKTGELNNSYIKDTSEKITEEAIKNSSAKLYPINTVIIAMYGATIGKVGILSIEACTNQACACAIPFSNICYKYLFYYCILQRENFIKIGKGGAQPNISQEIIKKYNIPLPPLNEQQRIVNVIESLFAKLDEAKQLIQNTIDKFEQNKMAILHKAFSGELTAKWREENNIDLSSWQSILLKKCVKLISGRDVPIKLCNDNGIGIPYILGASNINNNEFFIERWIEKPVVTSLKGDILLSVKGTIGKLYLQKEEFINISRQIMALRTTNIIDKFYLFFYMKKICEQLKFKGNGLIPGISRKDILDLEINLPTIEEQQAIVNILDRIFTKYDKIRDLQAQIDKIELLKKSILAKAFRGELGTNDPNEESAEVLLRKILAEK